MGYISLTILIILIATLVYMILESFKSPQEGTLQVITRFKKFRCAIMSVKGYRLNKPGEQFNSDFPEWQIIPITGKYKDANGDEQEFNYEPSWSERRNIYFFLWPISKTYRYSFTYSKLKKKGEEDEGDNIIWEDEKTKEIVVSRQGISDHIKWRSEYATLTGNLFSSEMGKIITFTNNTLEVKNPYKMMFAINDWLVFSNEKIAGALKGLVGTTSIENLNKIQSEKADEYNKTMEEINIDTATHEGLVNMIGVKLVKSMFKGFKPADEDCEKLVDSFTKPKIAEKEGEATIATAKAEGEAKVIAKTKAGEADVIASEKAAIVTDNNAKADAKALETKQEAIVKWKKKNLIDTGLAKVDASGNIVELIPDANTKVASEALKELSKLTGTLVMDGDLNKMLNITKPN